MLCIVLFSTPIDTYVSYALNRIFDTGVGVIAAFAVNYFLPWARVVALRSRVEGLFKNNVMKRCSLSLSAQSTLFLCPALDRNGKTCYYILQK